MKTKSIYFALSFLMLGCGEDLTKEKKFMIRSDELRKQSQELAKGCSVESDCALVNQFYGCQRPIGFSVLVENSGAYAELARIYSRLEGNQIHCTADYQPQDSIANFTVACNTVTNSCEALFVEPIVVPIVD